MNKVRIIPRLDIKGPNLVKGIHLEGLRVMGKPEDFAQYYYNTGADELIFMDTVASLYGRNNLFEITAQITKNVFVPITIGGGLRSVNDIQNVLKAGADRVAINTAALSNPELITDAANKFGSSTVVVSIEAFEIKPGKWEAYTDNGREYTGKDVLTWAKEAVDRGAGELLITSINREGTGKGFDIELIENITNSVSVPIISSGGCGNVDDIVNLVQKTNVNGVAIASILHYNTINYFSSINNTTLKEGNIEFLRHGTIPKNIEKISIPNIKKILLEKHVKCRSRS